MLASGVVYMPRTARKKSKSNIYHVMLRGINRQIIFQDDEDCEKYLQYLKACKAVSGFMLHAYCLMGNHRHLLIEEKQEPLEQISSGSAFGTSTGTTGNTNAQGTSFRTVLKAIR
jgi:hypothetical protein